MAGSQKDRPVDPDIEDTTTFEEKPTPQHRIVSVANMNVVGSDGMDYEMRVDGIPVANLEESQIVRVIQELALHMSVDGWISDAIKALSNRLSVPLKLHDPKPEEKGMAEPNPGSPEEIVQAFNAAMRTQDKKNSRLLPDQYDLVHHMVDCVVAGQLDSVSLFGVKIEKS